MPEKKELVFDSDDENVDKKKDIKTKKAKGGVNQNVTQGVHSASFKEFHLRNELTSAIGEAGFEQPSEVQQNGIPSSLAGDDIICQAVSGSGKTAVFVLSILNRLKLDVNHIQSLVLCPTRELAFQITREFQRLGKNFKDLRVSSIYGGDDIKKQILRLDLNPPQIIVATPGRILYLLEKGHLDFKNISTFVLDECDKILDQVGIITRYERRHSKDFYENQLR